jgi:hypothetical protein
MGEGRIGRVRRGGDKFGIRKKAREPHASFRLPDGRRWRGAPDEGLSLSERAAFRMVVTR